MAPTPATIALAYIKQCKPVLRCVLKLVEGSQRLQFVSLSDLEICVQRRGEQGRIPDARIRDAERLHLDRFG